MGLEANYNWLIALRCYLDRMQEIVSGGEILVEDIGLVHWRCKEYI